MKRHMLPGRRGAGRLTLTLSLIASLIAALAVTAPAASAAPATQNATGGQAATNCTTNAAVAVLGDLPPANDDLAEWLAGRGIPATRVFWDETFLAQVQSYDLIIFNRALNSSATEFLKFLADTDSAGAGVVFLGDRSNGYASGIGQLWTHTGNPSQIWSDYSSVSLYKFYDALAAHPVLDGFTAGERIVFDEANDFEFKEVFWFEGYQGGGRQIVGNAGFWFRGDQVKGPGIGVQERPNNRHALLSLHGVVPSWSPSMWDNEATQIFLNSMEWAAPADTPVVCNPA